MQWKWSWQNEDLMKLNPNNREFVRLSLYICKTNKFQLDCGTVQCILTELPHRHSIKWTKLSVITSLFTPLVIEKIFVLHSVLTLRRRNSVSGFEVHRSRRASRHIAPSSLERSLDLTLSLYDPLKRKQKRWDVLFYFSFTCLSVVSPDRI